MSYRATYHRKDPEVTVWDVHRQGWVRTSRPSDKVLAALPSAEVAKIVRHCGIAACPACGRESSTMERQGDVCPWCDAGMSAPSTATRTLRLDERTWAWLEALPGETWDDRIRRLRARVDGVTP